MAPGYLTESNAWFEGSGVAPAWNRMIFYDGNLFHCSDIPHRNASAPTPPLAD